MKIKKDVLMFGIFMFFFIAVGIRISSSLIWIKNVLNNGVSIRLMKEMVIYKDAERWRETALRLQTIDAVVNVETSNYILKLQKLNRNLESDNIKIQEYCKTNF